MSTTPDELRAARERLTPDVLDCLAGQVREGWMLPMHPTDELAPLLTLARAYLAANPADDGEPIVFTDDQCFALNAAQHDHRLHGYTCGNDSRHRPLIATRRGWRCADCDYRQGWAHDVNGPADRAALGVPLTESPA